MCGICASISQSLLLFAVLHDALELLQNRGYDSAGIALVGEQETACYKYASQQHQTSLEKLKCHQDDHDRPGFYTCGIAHTRWATHGSKTDENAHPHWCDSKRQGRVFVVHNGIIDNYQSLLTTTTNQYDRKSETDTEVIAILWASWIDSGLTVYDAFQKTVNSLHGTWAIVGCVEGQPLTLYASRNGSPLLLGFNSYSKVLFFASESSAFYPYDVHWLVLEDNETIAVSLADYDDQFQIQVQNHNLIIDDYVPRAQIHEIDLDYVNGFQRSPSPFPSWTEKEIYDQKDSTWAVLNRGGRIHGMIKLGGLESEEKKLGRIQHLVMVACGTSLHACQFGARYFQQNRVFTTVSVCDASEFELHCLPHVYSKQSIGVIVVSQSGETKDCLRVIEKVQNSEIITIGIVNVPGSSIARKTDCGVYLNCGREVGVASTKSFTSQVVVLLLVCEWFRQKNHYSTTRARKELSTVPNMFSNILHNPRIQDQIENLVPILASHQTIFLLGRGYGYPIVLEGALKIKELSYIHAEGYPGGGLKHGPFAVISDHTPIFLHIWTGPRYHRMISAAQEVHSRGAHTIGISNDLRLVDAPFLDQFIFLNIDNEMYASLVSVVIYQLLAVKLAEYLNHSADCPRHLAKVVTVDG